MAIIYVRKTGNDTTGDGSTGNPYLTINRALNGAAPKFASGDTLIVGIGAYTENSGSGYLNIPTYTSLTTIESETGAPADVTISGTTGTVNISVVGQYNKFLNVSLLGSAGAFALYLRGNYTQVEHCILTGTNNRCLELVPQSSGMHDISITDCVLSSVGAWALIYSANGISGYKASSVTFTRCTGISATDNYVVQLGNGNNADLVGWTFTDCKFAGATSTYRAFYVNGGTDVTLINTAVSNSAGEGTYANKCAGFYVIGGSYSAYSAHGLSIGSDTPSTDIVTGLMQYVTVTCTLGHGLLVGYGATSFAVSNSHMTGGDYGLVIKHCTGTVATYNTINGGRLSGIYFKAAVSPIVERNIISSSAAGVAIMMLQGNAGIKCENVTLTHNLIIANGTAGVFNWGGDADDLGGGVVDYNTYIVAGTDGFGTVRSSSGITDLGGLQAAWVGYTNPTNDTHSSVSYSTYYRYRFSFGYLKDTIATSPADAPLVTVVNLDTDDALVAGAPVVASANMPGAYFYDYYSPIPGLYLRGMLHTEDSTVDAQDLYSRGDETGESIRAALGVEIANLDDQLATLRAAIDDISALIFAR